MQLVRPGPEHLASYVAALEGGWSADNERGIEAAREELSSIQSDAAAFLASMEDREAKGPPKSTLQNSEARRRHVNVMRKRRPGLQPNCGGLSTGKASNRATMKMFGLTALAMFGLTCVMPAANKSDPLPPPVSDKAYTFAEIQREKAALKNKIVRVEILYLLGEPSDLLGNGTLRFICKDTSKGGTPYGQVAFPREALEKMALAQDPHRKGPFIVYTQVHVFAQKDAAAICIAVGTHVAVENGKATYSW
jgi:hypothetical protein